MSNGNFVFSTFISGEESFVVINSPVEEAMEVSSPGPAMKPGDGYTWSRQVCKIQNMENMKYLFFVLACVPGQADHAHSF